MSDAYNDSPRKSAAARLLFVLIGLLLTAPVQARAQPQHQFAINLATLPQSLAGHLHFLDDPEGTQTFAAVLRAWQQGQFQSLPGHLGRGYTDGVSWLALRLTNPSETPQDAELRLNPSYLNEVDIYVQQGGDDQRPADYRTVSLGDHAPVLEMPLIAPAMRLPLHLPPHGQQLIFIRVRTTSSHSLHGDVLSVRDANRASQQHIAIHSAYLGVAISLAIINLLLAKRLRSWVHLLYGSYLLSLFLSSFGHFGLLRLFWPAQTHHLSDVLVGSSFGLGVTLISGFGIALFDTRRFHPWVHRFLHLEIALGLVTVLVSASRFYGQVAQVLVLTGLVLVLMLPWLAWQMIRRGEVAQGRLFLLAFSMSVLGAVITFAGLLGLMPSGAVTHYALHATSVIHMIVMMRGLSERILAAEAALRLAAQHAESDALRLAARMTEDLAENQRALEQALAAERRIRAEQARFIDTISHEYRTPLSIIRTHLDVLHAKGVIGAPRMQALANALKRLNAIFDQAPQAHRSGRPPEPQIQPVALPPIIEALLGELRQLHPNHPVDVQPAPGPAVVLGDPTLIRIALRNLLENAAKYQVPQPQAPLIRLRITTDAHQLMLSLGNPCDPHLLPPRDQLFERFVRGRSRTQGGIGLGLSITRDLVENMGGEIRLQDSPPDWFEIALRLPLADSG
ncbi:Signal transduction histidine-protein kinase ArlS [Thiorhodovibrio winogradskyi]|uniref:histidine kinase n=1 Tax=Thiorhodovibrio winogradskyi TaxID=77007 RepID=A0ABZ0SEQ9_9GAMM|nr:sensor histidine kinase [Thiorhodovibrio winogradskyi]